MCCSNSSTGKFFRRGGRRFIAAIVTCLGLSGCANLDSGGDGLHQDSLSGYETSNWKDEIRLPDPRGEFFGLSNSARQIEGRVQRRPGW